MNKQHSILSMLERCNTMRELKQLHGFMVTTSQVRSVIPLSRLIDYCVNPETGDLHYAHSLFLQIDPASVYIWNSMIRGFSDGDQPLRALYLYKEMQQSGNSPDHFTFPFVLAACGKSGNRMIGKCVHDRILKTGFCSDLYVASSLIHMYVSCADLEAGKKVFEEMPAKNVVVYSTLIAGYVNNGGASEAVHVFKEMEVEEVAPNEITLVNVLVACAQSRDLETGRLAHSLVSNSSWKSNIILATAVLDMYAKCGNLKVAQDLFDKMPSRNLVSWNSIIGAYNQYGRANQTLRLFSRMHTEGIKPDRVTFLSLLGACSHLGCLVLGQAVHAYAEKCCSIGDVVGTSLLDMYAKTGDTQGALRVFGGLGRKDVKSWTSMISGLGRQGEGEEALRLFEEMQQEGIVPDHITYIGVLSACSHSVLVEEGRQHFSSMKSVHGIYPMVEHYGCMVDLLSRSGDLVGAEKMIEAMPIQPNAVIWGALLRGCQMQGKFDVAERVGGKISQLNPRSSGVYVLLSNIYAKEGRWVGAEIARQQMRHRGVVKTCAFSAVETRLLGP